MKLLTTVMSIVPPSYESIGENDDSEIWDSQVSEYHALPLHDIALHSTQRSFKTVSFSSSFYNFSFTVKRSLRNTLRDSGSTPFSYDIMLIVLIMHSLRIDVRQLLWVVCCLLYST